MKLNFVFLATLSLAQLSAFQSGALAQGTAFTYQGHLNAGSSPANGSYDLRVVVFDAATAGNQRGFLTNNAVGVSNGLFTTTLDFGFGVFNGSPRWLELAVRSNGTAVAFTPLSPRQAVTAAPYASWAANASQALTVSGTVPASGLNGLYSNPVSFNNPANGFVGDGGGLKNVNAAQLGGRTVGQFWQTGGNAGANPTNNAFLGTSDNQPLELRVNGQRALRLEPTAGSANVIGGYAGNAVTNGVVGAFIGGGGRAGYANRVTADYGSIPGGFGNEAGGVNSTAFGNQSRALGPNSTAFGSGCVASNEYALAMGAATVAGGASSTAMGLNTRATGQASTAMGWGTVATGLVSTAMGLDTVASGDVSTAMGRGTVASGLASTAMGWGTVATGLVSTAMGLDTVASGDVSTAMGRGTIASGRASTAMGFRARALHNGSFVWADERQTDFDSTANNQFNIRASGGVRLNNDTRLNFGNQTRQMLNLWDTGYGIGVQADAEYFRTGNDFHWYRGGSHSDVNGNGGGGVTLMSLNRAGNLGLGTPAPAYPLDVQSGLAVGRFTTTDNANGAVLVLRNNSTSPTYLGAINFEDSSTPGQIAYLANGQMTFRVAGGDRMNLQAGGLSVNGALVLTSDRNAKEGFAGVDAQEVLEKVAALPLQSWSYTNRPGVKHVGPMAQDFRAAFGLGEDDKHIATVDADGVALAAIQGLNQRLTEELKRRDSENASLKERVERLENLLRKLSDK